MSPRRPLFGGVKVATFKSMNAPAAWAQSLGETTTTQRENQYKNYFMKSIFTFNLISAIVILFLFLGYTSELSSQGYGTLSSYKPDTSLVDLAQFDNYFSESRVVGMGESTHGTHEFFLNRHRFFKYLVEHHGFNVFFLEADYSNCLRANRYINGAEDDLTEVVKSLAMWPWITEEMQSLILWMRNYNTQQDNDKKLQFIGCDMQRFNSTLSEINNIILKYDSTLINPGIDSQLVENDFSTFSEQDTKQHQMILNNKKVSATKILFEGRDEFIYRTLLRHLEQMIIEKGKENFQSYRDLKMGENILYHLNHNSNVKGFYWAHNWHVCNVYYPKKREQRSHYSAGGVLKNALGNKYFSIGQDFTRGSFNAYHMPNYKTTRKRDIVDLEDSSDAYNLGKVELETKEGELGYYFKDVDEPIVFIKSHDVQKYNFNKLLVHSIGADYVPGVAGIYLMKEYFDLVIIIKNTTETQLID
ncbi:erythromycin esterase family protein [Lewinella sp. IMCC34183]|uniref:erythromycin esterase family protein n=1 Tax=Lewinella sp. IMCC34183 TaxID=2248762 RepID=UPI000E2602E2|nr:erythromycin esterase family protein [Lewinella sp. IMCC34183]